MAIEKRISLTLDSSNVSKQIKTLRTELEGVQKAMPSSKSDPFAPMQKSVPKTRKALIDYKGALENTDRILKQSVGTTSLVEKQTLKHDTALRRLNKAYEEGKLDLAQYNAGLDEANRTNATAIARAEKFDTQLRNTSSGGLRMMRGSLAGLSYQFQDIAVQAQMGTNAMIILGQQGPQIASYFGPIGAVVGVFVAIGAAIAGTALPAFLDMTDAASDLDKSVDGFSATLKRSAGGIFEYTEEIRNLKKASDDAAQLQIAIALFDAQQAVEQAGKAIGQGLDDILQGFTDFSDFDYDDLIDNMQKLEDRGFTLGQVLSDGFEFSGRGFLVARKSTEELADIVGDLTEDLGLSKDQAIQFAEAIANINPTSGRSDFTSLLTTINSLRKELDGTGSKDQQAQFAAVSRLLLEIALKGESAASAVEALGQNTSTLKDSYVPLFTLNAELEKSIALTGQYGTETTNTLSDIQAEYSRLERIRKDQGDEPSLFNVTDAELEAQAQKNITQIIADRIAELDTYKAREAEIANLRKVNKNITDEQAQAALSLADAEDFVYKKRTDNLAALINDTETLSDIFEQGAKDYSDSVGSYNESLQGLVSSTFSSMEDAIVSFAETGKLSFSDFAKSVLSDLLRIQVQQQLAGLASSISGAIGGASAASSGSDTAFFSTANAAKGLAVTRYASGGVTGMANSIQSTPKYFANGGGLLGESAQSEAILPLTRTSGGDLGVKTSGGAQALSVNVNINDQTGGQVQFEQQSQTQNSDGSVTIDVVAKMVNQVISSGRADRSLNNRFGVRRQGA